MLTAAVSTKSASSASGNSSQVQVGSTPKARMKMKTTIRLRPRLNAAGEDDGERDHQARELGLADDALLGHDRGDRVLRRFLEEGEEDDAEQQQDRVVLDLFAADSEDLGEDEEQHPEQHQRPDQRPEVAEHGAEVDALELGHRDQPEQVEEARAGRRRGRRGRAPRAARCLGRAHALTPPPSITMRRRLVREETTPCGRRRRRRRRSRLRCGRSRATPAFGTRLTPQWTK